jgi:hypothetical protein
MYRVNNIGDSIPPYRTPLCISEADFMSEGDALAYLYNRKIVFIRYFGYPCATIFLYNLLHLTLSNADLASMKIRAAFPLYLSQNSVPYLIYLASTNSLSI